MSWNAINLVVNKGSSVLVRLLLARLLAPEHFGLIAMILVQLELVKIFVDFGLKNALVQRERDGNSLVRYDSAFWFLLGGGLGWTALFMLVGIPVMVWFFDEKQLTNLALVMGASIFLHSLSILPEVRLTRRMKFKSIVIAEVMATVVASIVAIVLAFAGAGVWALAAQQILTVGIRTIVLWQLGRWRPRWRYSWTVLRDLVGFSGWMLAVRVSDHMRFNMDKVIIGAILGSSPLGIYTISLLFTEQLRAQFSFVISRVYLPVFSRLQGDQASLAQQFYDAANRICLLIFPAAVIVFRFSDEIVAWSLDEAWSESAQVVEIMSISVMVYAISGPSPELLIAKCKPEVVFKTLFYNTMLITLPLSVFLTTNYALSGAATAGLLSMTTLRLSLFLGAWKIGGLKARRFLCAIAPGVILGAILLLLSTYIFEL